MFLKKARSSTDAGLRSLIQKATRRGYPSIVETVARRLDEAGDKAWLRSRAVVITFEECWPLAQTLSLGRGPDTKIEALKRVARATKQKDAAGLGALAFAYHAGDQSVLEGLASTNPVRLVSEALSRPSAFFEWANAQPMSEGQQRIVEAAKTYLAAATWGWDKACILAGAHLATCQLPSTTDDSPPHSDTEADFPFWVALDKHTPQGKSALHKIATELQVPYRKIIWSGFYFESATTNALSVSPWWQAERAWRLRKAGMTVDTAIAIWERVRPMLKLEVEPEAVKLRQTVEGKPAAQKEMFAPQT